MILRSPYPDVETPPASLPDLLFGGLSAADSAKTALIDAATGRRHTYGELVSAVDSVATALVARGISPGEVAALVALNSADYPVVFHGVLRAGGVLTPANPLYSAGELAHQFRDSRARFVHDPHPVLDADEVKEFVAARVAHYKKIRHVEFLEQIPKSAAGKILRKDLRSREASPAPQPTKELT